MNFKIDTKEKFTVITPLVIDLSANLTEELTQIVTTIQQQPGNVVLNMKSVASLDEGSATNLMALQQSSYEYSASFVICEIHPAVLETLKNLDLLDVLNITPTESEAWDIVQMEEIERELLGGGEELTLPED